MFTNSSSEKAKQLFESMADDLLSGGLSGELMKKIDQCVSENSEAFLNLQEGKNEAD